MKYPDRKTLFTLLGASALLIAGCGGGGGGGSSSNEDSDDGGGTATGGEVEITQSNGEDVARSTAVGTASIGQSSAQLTQSQIVGAAEIDGGLTGMSVAEATQFAILQARDQAGDTIDAVTGATTSYDCDSGSATIVDNGGTDGVLEEGDNWTATWDNCRINFDDSQSGTSFSFLLDGQVGFSVPTCTNCDNVGDGSVDWEYGIEITYTDWLIKFTENGVPIVDILFDGTLALGAVNSTGDGTTTFTVTGGPFSINDNLNSTSVEYAALDLEDEVDTTTGEYTTTVTEITLTSNNLNGQVTASTLPGDPFVGNGGYPTSGTLQINGANGSSAIVYAADCSASEFRLVVNGVDEGCKDWVSG